MHQEWYSYDYANNLTGKVVNSVATTYTYDEIDQLRSEISSATFGVNDLYTYDHNGNRKTKLSAIGGLQQYTYDDADKLMSVDRNGSVTNYTYDNCGRPTNIGSRTLTWDYEDRLTNLTGSGVPSTNYGYSGVGSRVTKANSSGTRAYKRDGVGVTAPVLSDGVSTMVPGISEKSNGQTNYIHTDRLGSMKGMSNGTSVTETADYDAFGKVISHTNSSDTQKGFASGFGYQEDGESGYKLLGHRYYDADTGRFLSRDRAQDGRNWYSYVDNSPLKAIDAEGLKKKLVVILGDINQLESGLSDIITYLYRKYGKDYDIIIIRPKSLQEAEDLMVEADALIIYGHGSDTTGPVIAGKGFDSNRLRNVRDRRRKLGKKKLAFAHLLTCNAFAKAEWKALWAAIAEEVLGAEGWTLPSSYGIGDGGGLLEAPGYPPAIIIRSPKPTKTGN